jgi:regulator of sirC expression with transglutaminase-like and TPR domain
LISELSRIAHDLNSVWPPSGTLKKYRALLAQLNLNLEDQDLDPFERFEVLKTFFFEQKKFSPMVSKPKLEKYLLPYVLLSRSGPPELLLLLFICLAQSLQLPLQVIKNDDAKIVIKVIHEGKSFLFDFQRHCETLNSDEILDLINGGCDATKCLSVDEVMSRYLLTMKTQSLRERSFLSLYTILTYLIHHQPFVLNHIVDRARAAYAIGDLVKAAEDIGQYLSFHSEKMSNYKFLKLIRKLNRENLLKNIPPFRDN